jgi:hypothetical protein
LRLGNPIVIRFVCSNRYFVAWHTAQLFAVMSSVATAVHNLHTKHLTTD